MKSPQGITLIRTLTIRVVALIAIAAIGWSAAAHAHQRIRSLHESDTTASAAKRAVKIFGTGQPVSVVTWWRAHPSLEPQAYTTDTLLLNQRSRGPRTVELPSLKDYTALVIAVTCATRSPYEVALTKTRASKSVTSVVTGGGSCGGPNVNTYTSPFSKNAPPRTAHVKVANGVAYYITIFGQPIQRKVK